MSPLRSKITLSLIAAVIVSSLVLVRSPSAQTTLILIPSDDAHIDTSDRRGNYGLVPELSVVKTNAYEHISYIKFNISQLDTSQVIGASLKLYLLGGSSQNQTLRAVSSDWNETDLIARSAPPVGDVLTSMLGYTDGTWVEFDVTNYLMSHSGEVSFAITADGSDDIILTSKESPQNNPHLLLVTNQTDAIPDTDITNDGNTDSQDAQSVATNFNQSNCDNPADINGDCIVNIFDYASVVSQIQ